MLKEKRESKSYFAERASGLDFRVVNLIPIETEGLKATFEVSEKLMLSLYRMSRKLNNVTPTKYGK